MAKILIVDDEPQIRAFLRISLGAHGYETAEAGRDEQAVQRCATEQPELVVLDLGLPDMDGLEVIRRIREWSAVPILVLSVRAGDADKVGALDAGAQDYVTKPFSIAELMARLRALLRDRARSGEPEPSEIAAGDVRIDLARRRVTAAGREVKLSRREFDLLALLARHAGRILTHRQLLEQLWGPAHVSETHYLRIYVAHLREKLGDDPSRPRYIVTEPGIGYRFLEE
jgi:two-component system KDP operon response regulator KdpE